MSKRKRPTIEPSHHLIVENEDWSRVIDARRDGVSWDDLRTRNGLSVLGMAIFSGSALAVQMFLATGAPMVSELIGGTWFSPLWAAIEKRNPDMLDYLLQAGADPNEAHPEKGDPLRYVSREGLILETVMLCRHGAKPNMDETPSALWYWIENMRPAQDSESGSWTIGDTRPIAALLTAGARVDTELDIPFARASWERFPLDEDGRKNVAMMLALMERAALGGVSRDARERPAAGRRDNAI